MHTDFTDTIRRTDEPSPKGTLNEMKTKSKFVVNDVIRRDRLTRNAAVIVQSLSPALLMIQHETGPNTNINEVGSEPVHAEKEQFRVIRRFYERE